MLATCKDELICDFAEVYRIYDIYQYRASYISVLAVGLRDNSRTKLKLIGQKAPLETIVEVSILDRLNQIAWMLSTDSNNPPEPIAPKLFDKETKEFEGFDSIEEFQKVWDEINQEGGVADG